MSEQKEEQTEQEQPKEELQPNQNKKQRTKQEKAQIIAYVFTMVSFIAPVIYLIFKMIFGNFDGNVNDAGYHSRADYLLMIAQCLLGALALNLPTILGKTFKFEVPAFLYIFYIIFLYCSIFLGEVRSFYYVFTWWDSFLHGTSSLMFGFFGIMVVTVLNHDEKTVMNLSPFVVCLFGFCFALMLGTLWEIYEFSADGLFGFNMQKFMQADGTVLQGREALFDTMKDLITDSVGILLACIVGYISLKKKHTWLVPKITSTKGGQKTTDKNLKVSPFSASLFVFCFIVTMVVIWQIYEFIADGLFDFNLQHYKAEDGTLLLGHDALKDTMRDIMGGTVVAIMVAIAVRILIQVKLKYKIKTTNKQENLPQENQVAQDESVFEKENTAQPYITHENNADDKTDKSD